MNKKGRDAGLTFVTAFLMVRPKRFRYVSNRFASKR